MVSIRSLTQNDESILWDFLYYALYVSSNSQPFPRSIVRQPEISRYVEGWGRTHDQGFLAEDEQRPIGCAWIRVFAGNQPGFGYINDFIPELSIAVLPDFRKKGIGTELFSRLLEQISALFPAISLSVHKENPARRIYERFGFEVMNDSGESITMIKTLSKVTVKPSVRQVLESADDRAVDPDED